MRSIRLLGLAVLLVVISACPSPPGTPDDATDPLDAVAQEDAPGLDAAALDAAGLDAPGLDAPATLEDAPGLDVGPVDAARGPDAGPAPGVTWDPRFASSNFVDLARGVEYAQSVRALAPISATDTMFGGSFRRVGTDDANLVVRWDGQRFHPIPGAPFPGSVDVMLRVGGRVYVGGNFVRYGTSAFGDPVNSILSYDIATGRWSELGTGVQNELGDAGIVSALVATADGQVIVGGSFSTAGGIPANGIAMWDPSTSTWSALGSGVALETGASGSVRSLAIRGQVVYVGGDFVRAGGITVGLLAIFDLDTYAWRPMGSGTPPSAGSYGRILRLEVWNDRVLVLGAFNAVDFVPATNAALYDPATNRFAPLVMTDLDASYPVTDALVLGPDEVLLVTESTSLFLDDLPVYRVRGGISSRVSCALAGPEDLLGRTSVIDRMSDGTLAIGGTIRDVSWGAGLVELRPSGCVSLTDGVLTAPDATDTPVRALAVEGSSLAVGGSFASMQGVLTSNAAALDLVTDEVTAILPEVMGTVHAVALDGDRIYLGGAFSMAGGVSASNVVAWVRSAGRFEALGSGANAPIWAIHVAGPEDVYFAGQFTMVDGISARRVARRRGGSWEALGAGLDGGTPPVAAYALERGPDGRVYVGGSFLMAGGAAAPRVAVWDSTTSTWSALGEGFSDGTVRALAHDGTSLFAGGDMSMSAGVAVGRVARWDGSAWSGTGATSTDMVRALAVTDSGALYAGGDFSTLGAVSAAHIARFTAGRWSALGAGIDGPVHALVADGMDVFAGGAFRRAGGLGASNVAHLHED